MWNNLLKLTLASYVWKRYRRTLIALPVLLIYFWLVNLIHNDYLAYAELDDSQMGVGLSFVIKWVLVFIGFIIFIIIHFTGGSRNSGEHKQVQPGDQGYGTGASASHADASDAIRQKQKLRSRADMILEKNSQ
ncbi:MAG: hypothetical protein AAFZ92_01365 [Pseudomonadota bacterium]